MQGIEAARVLGNQPPLSGSVGHLHRRRGRCERHPVGRVSTLPLGPLQARAAKNRPAPVAAPPGRTLREADQAHKLGPLASDHVGDPTARRQTPERERVKRVCGNHSLAAVIERPQSPLAEGRAMSTIVVSKDTIGRARAITPKATTDPDQKTARPIGRRRWPKFCRGSHRLACAQSG